MDKSFVIGVTGATGSGKTFVIEELKKIFSPKVVVISQDNYYKNLEELGVERWDRANYDKPESFDNNSLAKDLSNLKKGHPVHLPVYDFKTHSRLASEVMVKPAQIIIIEGIFIFNILSLRKLMDLKIFLQSEADIRLSRRLLRDIQERGRKAENLAESINWYLKVVKPNQEKYIIPMKRYADMMINTNEGGIAAVDILKKKIQNILAGG